jgi:hypothetical protein
MKTQQISRRALASGLALASLAPLSARANEPHCDAELIDLDAALVRAWAAQDEIAPAHDRELEHAMSACRAIVESILVIPARTLDGLARQMPRAVVVQFPRIRGVGSRSWRDVRREPVDGFAVVRLDPPRLARNRVARVTARRTPRLRALACRGV